MVVRRLLDFAEASDPQEGYEHQEVCRVTIPPSTRWPESVRVSTLTRARLFFTLRRHRDTPTRLPRVVERVLTERAKHGASGADGE